MTVAIVYELTATSRVGTGEGRVASDGANTSISSGRSRTCQKDIYSIILSRMGRCQIFGVICRRPNGN